MKIESLKHSPVGLASLAVFLLCHACQISDEDRCPSGWFYVSELSVCCPDEPENDTTKKYVYQDGGCVAVDKDIKDTGSQNGGTGDEDTTDGGTTDDTSTGDGTTDDTSVDTSGGPTGLGASCADNPDACEGLDADFCAANPIAPQDAYCTLKDCSPGACPGGYQCCDCTASTILPKEKACLTDADAGLATAAAGCTCQ